ncbi:MAG TPA: vanadium-dependent haloperoxidase [Thermoanaerobaculia bacterium]|nr:vanadium-dependent haloperoxidase [Thermoanaerobaculia bacterium]
MFRRLLGTALCIAALLGLAGPVRADVITDWNEILLQAIRVDKTSPPKASRAMAIMNVAIYDAVNGLVGGYTPLIYAAEAPAGALPDVAAAAAARKVLVTLFPAQTPTFDAAFDAFYNAIPNSQAKSDGATWGLVVGDRILTRRADDHSGDTVDYFVPTGGSWWAPTAPAFASALLPNWPLVTPWTMTSGSQFRQDPPPVPGSAEYTRAFIEVRRLGRVDSPVRTAEQTQIALFWADGSGTATPPGHWILIAIGLSEEKHLSLIENARLFALLGITLADAAVVSWDHKYHYSIWRPITGIQNADIDGNPHTTAEKTWGSLLPTPPFPSYTSGHSTFSASAAKILELFFGTDAIAFSTTSDALPGVTRTFTSLSKAAEEAGQSRVYGGIHWQFDNQAGLASGRALAQHVFYNFLTPVQAASTCVANATTLCLNGGRFKVQATWRSKTNHGPAQVLSQTGDSGQFFFFDDDNLELVVKVLNGCGVNQQYWVFASGLTDVEVLLTVTDTETGHSRQYFNPLGTTFAPVADASAFSCE